MAIRRDVDVIFRFLAQNETLPTEIAANLLRVADAVKKGQVSIAELNPLIELVQSSEANWENVNLAASKSLEYITAKMGGMQDQAADLRSQLAALGPGFGFFKEQLGTTTEAGDHFLNLENELSKSGDVLADYTANLTNRLAALKLELKALWDPVWKARGVAMELGKKFGYTSDQAQEAWAYYGMLKNRASRLTAVQYNLAQSQKSLWEQYTKTIPVYSLWTEEHYKHNREMERAKAVLDKSREALIGYAREGLPPVRRGIDVLEGSFEDLVKGVALSSEEMETVTEDLTLTPERLTDFRKEFDYLKDTVGGGVSELEKFRTQMRDANPMFVEAEKVVDSLGERFKTGLQNFKDWSKVTADWSKVSRAFPKYTTAFERAMQSITEQIPTKDINALYGALQTLEGRAFLASKGMTPLMADMVNATVAARGQEQATNKLWNQLGRIAQTAPTLAAGIVNMAVAGEMNEESLKKSISAAQDATREWDRLTPTQRAYVQEMVKARVAQQEMHKALKPVMKTLLASEKWAGYQIEMGVEDWDKWVSSVARALVAGKDWDHFKKDNMKTIKKWNRELGRAGIRIGWMAYRLTVMGRIIQRYMTQPMDFAIKTMTNWEKSLETVATTMGLLIATGQMTGEMNEFLGQTMQNLITHGMSFQAAWQSIQSVLIGIVSEIAPTFIPLIRHIAEVLIEVWRVLEPQLIPAFEKLANEVLPFLVAVLVKFAPAIDDLVAGMVWGIAILTKFLDVLSPYVPFFAKILGLFAAFAPVLVAVGTAAYFLSPILLGINYAISAMTYIVQGANAALFLYKYARNRATEADIVAHATTMRLIATLQMYKWQILSVIGIIASLIGLYWSLTQTTKNQARVSTKSFKDIYDAAKKWIPKVSKVFNREMGGTYLTTRSNLAGVQEAFASTAEGLTFISEDMMAVSEELLAANTLTIKNMTGEEIGAINLLAGTITDAAGEIVAEWNPAMGTFVSESFGAIENMEDLYKLFGQEGVVITSSGDIVDDFGEIKDAVVGVGSGLTTLTTAIEDWSPEIPDIDTSEIDASLAELEREFEDVDMAMQDAAAQSETFSWAILTMSLAKFSPPLAALAALYGTFRTIGLDAEEAAGSTLAFGTAFLPPWIENVLAAATSVDKVALAISPGLITALSAASAALGGFLLFMDLIEGVNKEADDAFRDSTQSFFDVMAGFILVAESGEDFVNSLYDASEAVGFTNQEIVRFADILTSMLYMTEDQLYALATAMNLPVEGAEEFVSVLQDLQEQMADDEFSITEFMKQLQRASEQFEGPTDSASALEKSLYSAGLSWDHFFAMLAHPVTYVMNRIDELTSSAEEASDALPTGDAFEYPPGWTPDEFLAPIQDTTDSVNDLTTSLEDTTTAISDMSDQIAYSTGDLDFFKTSIEGVYMYSPLPDLINWLEKTTIALGYTTTSFDRASHRIRDFGHEYEGSVIRMARSTDILYSISSTWQLMMSDTERLIMLFRELRDAILRYSATYEDAMALTAAMSTLPGAGFGGTTEATQYITIYPTIIIESITGEVDLDAVQEAVNQGIAEAWRSRMV